MRELKKANRRLLQRIQNQYLLCIDNLLIKAGWLSFLPAESFNYNVHVGIDVGGPHNNQAVLCVGSGFATLGSSAPHLAIVPKRIAAATAKVEPIPTASLREGLVSTFEEMHAKLDEIGVRMDLERVLFIRDGSLLGQTDPCNEMEALRGLARYCRSKGWVSGDAVWSTCEVHKRAENWKLVAAANGNGFENPIVGQCVRLHGDDERILVCTTGQPTLTQGTASPLMLRCGSILGPLNVDDVVRDIVWEADMGYTKADMGRSLPWVLHIADEGALQAAMHYQFTGVTV